MATLTTQQQQDLWDNRFESCKCYNSETQDSSSYERYRFASRLDGHNYYVVIESGNGVTHSSTATTCETKVKEQLALMDYKEPIVMTTANV